MYPSETWLCARALATFFVYETNQTDHNFQHTDLGLPIWLLKKEIVYKKIHVVYVDTRRREQLFPHILLVECNMTLLGEMQAIWRLGAKRYSWLESKICKHTYLPRPCRYDTLVGSWHSCAKGSISTHTLFILGTSFYCNAPRKLELAKTLVWEVVTTVCCNEA